MEADFFRCLAPMLARTLTGARCRKIAFPAPGLFSLGLSGAAAPQVPDTPESAALHDFTPSPPPTAPRFLHGRTGPGRFLLFFSDHKPAYPAAPPAKAMWLRKRLDGRRILGVLGDWPTRRLALVLSQGEGRYFVIDAKAGLSLADALPEDFGREPDWPDLAAVRRDPDVWQAHPQVTPRLRRAVAGLPEEASRTFYEAVRRGEPDGFFVIMPGPAGQAASGASPDALPLDVFCRAMPGLPPGAVSTPFPDPLAAAAAFGAPHFFAAAGGDEAKKVAVSEKTAARRLAKALERLDRDAARLTAMIGQGDFAEAIAANLHGLDARARTPDLTLAHPEKGMMTQALDPRLTILENMNRLFERAAKGRRGLAVVAARRAALADPARAGDPGAGWPARPAGPAAKAPPAARRQAGGEPEPGRFRGIPAHVYRTGDGFTVLRGKNARANEELLRKAAAPFDYWFHVAGGPGSHVILRRDHPGREVPRQSLVQAAVLAALASWRADDAKAEVLLALVKDVRRGKGFAPGQVRVDQIIETLAVDLDPALETALRQP
jgi:hypothetical protein